MSFPVGQITCTRCPFVQSIVHSPVTVRYQIDSDHHFDHYRDSAWCTVCQRVQDVEAVPKPEVIDAELLAAEQSARGTAVDRLKDKVRLRMSSKRRLAQKQMMRLRLKKEWLGQRRSPPRCLSCGSTELLSIDWGSDVSDGDAEPNRRISKNFRHDCAGRLVLIYSSGIRYNVAGRRFVLDAEGRLIGIDADDGVSDEMEEFLQKIAGD